MKSPVDEILRYLVVRLETATKTFQSARFRLDMFKWLIKPIWLYLIQINKKLHNAHK